MDGRAAGGVRNDPGQEASIGAVTARSNRQWLGTSPEALCWYSAERVATKLRWGLAVDEAERDGLQEIAAGCGGTDVECSPAPYKGRRRTVERMLRRRIPLS